MKPITVEIPDYRDKVWYGMPELVPGDMLRVVSLTYSRVDLEVELELLPRSTSDTPSTASTESGSSESPRRRSRGAR